MIKVVNPIKNNDCSSNIKDFEAAGAEKIYERDGYIILRVKRGYIVYNTRKRFENGHTHIQSFEMAKTIIDNNIRKKRPKTNSIYLIESHIRVTNDSKYKKMLQELLASKEDRTKDNKYHNKNMCSSF